MFSGHAREKTALAAALSKGIFLQMLTVYPMETPPVKEESFHFSWKYVGVGRAGEDTGPYGCILGGALVVGADVPIRPWAWSGRRGRTPGGPLGGEMNGCIFRRIMVSSFGKTIKKENHI